MKYRVSVLTPLLVGDGRSLAPIDYMIWRDQVNVLNQDRIFRLLARGPRLDPYLAQLRRAEKLDFASWGGFAQNYAGRRIPFESAGSTAVWQQTAAEHLHIPTFAAGIRGPYIPGSALKGALRTGYVFTRWNTGIVQEIAKRMESDRSVRRPGAAAESMTIGTAAADPMRVALIADSNAVEHSNFKIYLTRVAKLQARQPNTYELGWKQAPRGTAPAQRVDQSTPTFVEMAVPGTQFGGDCSERDYLKSAELTRVLHWRNQHSLNEIVSAANRFAAHLLAAEEQYAEIAKLPRVGDAVRTLKAELQSVEQQQGECLLNLGWGGGFTSKAAVPDSSDDEYRRVLRQLPFFSPAIRSGLLFPKTRRVVFLDNQPATLPGWVRLEIE
jgi:CRISPR-associated protein Csm5